MIFKAVVINKGAEENKIMEEGGRKKSKGRPRKKGVKTLSSEPSGVLLERIRERAYFIWEGKGWPDNSALDNWLQAERETSKN